MTPADEWARCKGWLQPAVDAQGLYDMAYIEAEIEAGRMHFWPGKNSVAVTEFQTFPKAKVLNVFAVGGRKGFALHELTMELEPALVAWGRANGCKKIIGYGVKPNWRPVCEAMGFSHLWTVMAKDI